MRGTRKTTFTFWRPQPAIPEIIDTRIYLGIHFRFADTESRSQGRRAANHTFKNILTPVDKKLQERPS